MARIVNCIWARFALVIMATVLVTLGVQAGAMYVYSQIQYQQFYKGLPQDVRLEVDILSSRGDDDDPRLLAIYGQYWHGDPWDSDVIAIGVGLLFCLPIGLAAGLWASRMVTRPIRAVAQAAGRVALGDFSVRAHAHSSGELGGLVKNFNRMTDALEALERERKSTVAAISHELRTPLAVLQARLLAIYDGVIPMQPTEFARLLEQVRHLGRLVDDLHTLSVADAGRLSLHMVRIDLGSLVRDTLAKYASRLREHGMRAELDERGSGHCVRADEDRMRQILNNLIENVLQHAHAGGWLEIGLRCEGHQALLSISDAGPGLPASFEGQVFQRFRRGDDSRNRATGGSGLGLSIVYALVQLHGGHIGVDRSTRGGTRFEIALPAA